MAAINYMGNKKKKITAVKKVYNKDKTKKAVYISSIDNSQLRFFIKLGIFFIITADDINKKKNIISKIPQNKLLIDNGQFLLVKNRKKYFNPKGIEKLIKDISLIRKKTSSEDIKRIINYNTISFFELPFKFKDVYVYKIRNSLYINLTNRCTNNCIFCPRKKEPVVKGYYLKINKEPSAERVIKEIGDAKKYDEIVFCGYGEPTLKLKVIKKIAEWIKENGGKTRLNTNGQGSIIAGRDITPELKGLFDTISISLNFHTKDLYLKYCRPVFGKETWNRILDFTKKAKMVCPKIILTVIEGCKDVDVSKCKKIADKLQVNFRKRTYYK